ncbi:MAG: pyridoxal phosphate-dependent aminotransferase, partial [Bacteroidales bacterium]|nr:pyridoxal phosphate-dependent aminotransferase [Bacteroidales bacterium]
ARLPVEDAGEFAKWLLTDFRMDGQTVMITPAAAFYKTPGLGRDQARIAYVLEVPQLKKAMSVLATALETYRG